VAAASVRLSTPSSPGIIQGISTSTANNVQKAFASTTPTCCGDQPNGYLLNSGTDTAGNLWMACYWPGTDKIYDFIVATMNWIHQFPLHGR